MNRPSDGAHELALTIINDGKGYQRRVNTAVRSRHSLPSVLQLAAAEWVDIAREGARAYERAFGSPGASCFTVEDILGAALELAEYYEQHARENEETDGRT